MRTVDLEPQVFSYFVQRLTDRASWEAGAGGHAPRYGCRLNKDCWRFRFGTLNCSYGAQRFAIARRSFRVVDSAERPCDDVRCHILQHEPQKRREGKWMIPGPVRVQETRVEEKVVVGREEVSVLSFTRRTARRDRLASITNRRSGIMMNAATNRKVEAEASTQEPGS